MNWLRYWNIILYRTYAELKSEAQLNYMGYAWWLLEPLFNTLIFYTLLVVVMQQSTVGATTFLLVGTVTWQWFNGVTVGSANSIFDAGSMLKFIYLPKIVMPLIAILAHTWKFLFLFILLLIWCWCSGKPPSFAYLALPLIMVLQLATILSVSLPIAAAIPYFPDARLGVDALLRPLMLISGIFFSVSQIPVAYHVYFYLNPMAVLIESYRNVLLDGVWPNWYRLAYVGLFSTVLILIALRIYKKIDLTVVKSIHR